jgi:hypothetical protein
MLRLSLLSVFDETAFCKHLPCREWLLALEDTALCERVLACLKLLKKKRFVRDSDTYDAAAALGEQPFALCLGAELCFECDSFAFLIRAARAFAAVGDAALSSRVATLARSLVHLGDDVSSSFAAVCGAALPLRPPPADCCAVCCEPLGDAASGVDCCDDKFHVHCIRLASAHETRCPVCRRPYSLILSDGGAEERVVERSRVADHMGPATRLSKRPLESQDLFLQLLRARVCASDPAIEQLPTHLRSVLARARLAMCALEKAKARLCDALC